ncbi:MAG: Hsp33 family molecular chaperone HslO, partial [Clostridia bacterium]|nr:Hsp33 family molecular chaperone HslO [Clostridia bacterium]
NILQRQEPKFACDCSRERIERALIAMGYDELKAMRDEDGKAELWCNFCNTTYDFSGEDLDALLETMRR